MSSRFEGLAGIVPTVSRETFQQLEAFEGQFLKWAQKINLSAPSTLSDVWNRHILDSAQLLPLAPQARVWLDLGSGGGFPGLVLAFLLRGEKGRAIDLVESNRKKAGFLQAMIGQFGLPARVHAQRVDDLSPELTRPDVVTARAVAPLPVLFELTERWLAKGSSGLFHKGRDYADEIKETSKNWTFDLVEHRSKTDSQGVILEITDISRRTKS